MVKILVECYSISINELIIDEKWELIKVMNYFCVVVSLFFRWLIMLN